MLAQSPLKLIGLPNVDFSVIVACQSVYMVHIKGSCLKSSPGRIRTYNQAVIGLKAKGEAFTPHLFYAIRKSFLVDVIKGFSIRVSELW